MATALKLRRGTTAQHSAFTGELAEVTVDTDKDTVVVHDGSTAGGFPLAKANGSAINPTSVGATTAGTGAFTTLSMNGGALSPQTGFKNRIINGAMTIDQRNAGAAINSASGAGNYAVDRFAYNASQTGKVNLQQTTANIAQTNGFGYCLAVTSTSAYSVTSTDYFFVEQRIEGSNIADIGWGTSASKAVAMSFVVYSSLTGTFGGSLIVGSGSYPFSYSVPVANTWTQISVSVPANTTYTPTSLTNGTGVRVMFGLGSGSTLTAAAGSWQSGTFVQPTGSVSVVGTSGATFYITGVQLEKGTAATPFEFRSIGTELGLCQRYAFVTDQSTGIAGFVTIQNSQVSQRLSFPVQMRADPTASIATAGKWTVSDDRLADYEAATFTIIGITSSTQMARVIIGGFTSTPAAGTTLGSMPYGGSNGKILFSSEL